MGLGLSVKDPAGGGGGGGVGGVGFSALFEAQRQQPRASKVGADSSPRKLA